MNRMRFLSGLKYLFLILNSLVAVPVAFADQDDYLQLLRSDLNRIAADYITGNTSVSCRELPSHSQMQPTPRVLDCSPAKPVIASKPQANSGTTLEHKYANPPSVYTAGRTSTERNHNNKNQITSQPPSTISEPAEYGLIKSTHSSTLSDAAFLKAFIASANKSNLGYYYKILNAGEGRNACYGQTSFHMIESTVTKIKDQDDFTIQCQDLPAVLSDALSKIKKKGQIELVTSAYQIYNDAAIENGYQTNSLIKFNIKSLN